MESQPPRSRTLVSRTRNATTKATRATSIGSNAEDRALAWLEHRGLELVERNYRCRYGELDLVMLDRSGDTATLVIVEVRCRQGRSFTSAALTVHRAKQRRLASAALLFVASRNRFSTCPVRFDVVGFDGAPDKRQRVAWIRDAFRPE